MFKKCLIVCWYGKFPEYFKFWEKSCSLNKSFDFYVFTDQDYDSLYENIKIIKMDLSELENLISKKLGLDIKINHSYKLCDFKPIYGKIFSDYIREYDFWGHCDIDLVFGDLDKFVTDEVLNEYEKINKYGHFVLFKNNDKMNNLFMQKGSLFDYKEVVLNDENYAFDEYKGMNLICDKNNINLFNIDELVDVDVKYRRFRDVNKKNYKKQVYLWDNGKLFHVYFDNNCIHYVEKMYLHFQKKKPKKCISYDSSKYFISGYGFIKYDSINENNIEKYDYNDGILYEFYEKNCYYIKRMFDFFKFSRKEKRIWLRKKFNIK